MTKICNVSFRLFFNSENSTSNELFTGQNLNSMGGPPRRVLRIRHSSFWSLALLIMAFCSLAISGCGFYTVNQAGSANRLSVPASVSFGSVFVGERASVKVSLVNKGTSPLKISKLAVTGKYFSVGGSGNLPITLAAGGTYELTLQFDPTVSGAATGRLTITSQTLSSTTSVITLSGTGDASTPTLAINAATISFGTVVVNNTATQSVTLTSTGVAPVTISTASLTGKGFTTSALTLPLTLDPGQTATLSVQFDPTAVGTASGQLTIISNSSTGAKVNISLSGTGALHAVQLTWNPPVSSKDPIAGYHIYRSPSGSSSYQRLNTSVDMETSYIDGTVESGLTYDYYVTDIDTSGTESGPSNLTSVIIP